MEGHGTLGLHEIWIGISRLGFQTTRRIVRRSLMILSLLEVAKDVKKVMEGKEKLVMIRYMDFIDQLKSYLSPPERRQMENTCSIMKKKQNEMSANLDSFDTTRNVAVRTTSSSIHTSSSLSSSTSSSISSSTSSSLRTSLMRQHEVTDDIIMPTFQSGDLEAEARERQLMQAEEWHQERVTWGLSQHHGAWEVVRVFVSSTFKDFHGERDVLQKDVFPELNELLRSRRVRVVPVDLRWGLTKEDTSATGLGAIEYCLREVDASRPFFLMMEGERYGWVPPEYKVSDRQEVKWLLLVFFFFILFHFFIFLFFFPRLFFLKHF